jgi:uncharacterized protein involved in outer membrane biogenesis
MRKAAVVAAVVVIAAAVMAIVLPRVLPLDFLKPRIVALLEEKTGRKVGFSEVSLLLFPGIGLKIEGLTVSGDPGHPDEKLLSVPEAEVRVAIGPLLAGRVEFGKVVLRRSQVTFRKYRDGTHSATQMSERLARKEEAAPTAAREPVSVALRTLSVEEAKFHLFLEDEDGRETHWEIDPFTFHLDGIGRKRNDFRIETRIGGALQGEIRIDGSVTREEGKAAESAPYRLAAEGKVFGQPVSVDGRISAPLGVTEADLSVTFPKIDMEKLPGMFAPVPPWLAKASPEGLATLAVKVSGNLQAMGFEAEADLTRAGWTVMPGMRKFIDAPCTVVAQGRRFPDLYVISNAELAFPPLRVIANASLFPSTGEREWTASARLASLSELAKNRGGGLSKWSPSGQLTAFGKGRRPAASEKDTWNVSLDLGNVALVLPEEKMDLRDLDGHVEITSRAVDFQPLSGLCNGQRFSLQGTVSLGAAPVGQVSLRMPYLDLDAMFPPGEAGGQTKEKKPAPPAGKGAEQREIAARGNVRIDAGKIRGVEFKDLAGIGRYEGGTLSIDSLRANLYGGEATAAGRVRFRPPVQDFRVKVALKNLAADEVLSRTTRLKNFLSGAASLSADLGGGSRDFAEFTRTASGSGSFRVTGGKIKGVDLLSAAAGLSGLPALSPAKEALDGGKAMETSFSDLGADFRIEGGKIRTDGLRIASGKLSLDGKAALGFDRAFDFRGTLALSKDLSQGVRGGQGKFLLGPSGRVEIPLVMSGPVTSPAIALDGEALAKGIAGRAIRKLLERAPERPAPSDAEPSKPQDRPAPEKMLKGLFDRLLPGKK